jgi:hypothetical protein
MRERRNTQRLAPGAHGRAADPERHDEDGERQSRRGEAAGQAAATWSDDGACGCRAARAGLGHETIGDQLQHERHVPRVLEPFGRGLGETAAHDALERGRRDRLEVGHRVWLAIHDRGDQARLALARERRGAGRHFVEHAAQRPEVAAGVGLLGFEDLGRHVLERADDRAFTRERRGDGRRLRERTARRDPRGREPGGTRETEVHELRPGAGEHDVARLEIAMNHAGAMRALERLGDLGAELEQLGGRQRSTLEPGGQRVTVHQLHHQVVDVTRPGFAGCPADVEQGADIGVAETRDGLGLAFESRPHLGVGRQVLGQHLDRHVAPEPRVPRAVNLAHTARSDRSEDFVRAETGSESKRHGAGV